MNWPAASRLPARIRISPFAMSVSAIQHSTFGHAKPHKIKHNHSARKHFNRTNNKVHYYHFYTSLLPRPYRGALPESMCLAKCSPVNRGNQCNSHLLIILIKAPHLIIISRKCLVCCSAIRHWLAGALAGGLAGIHRAVLPSPVISITLINNIIKIFYNFAAGYYLPAE